MVLCRPIHEMPAYGITLNFTNSSEMQIFFVHLVTKTGL
jgi:hypothetical protein